MRLKSQHSGCIARLQYLDSNFILFFLGLVWFCLVCMHESPKGSMETDDIDANVNTGQTTNLRL